MRVGAPAGASDRAVGTEQLERSADAGAVAHVPGRAPGPRRPRRRRAARSPGWPSTSRWRTSTGPSTTRVPGTLARRARAGHAGPGPLRRAATSTASWSSGSSRSEHEGAADPAAARGVARSRCSRRRCARCARAVADRYAGDAGRRAAPGGPAAARAAPRSRVDRPAGARRAGRPRPGPEPWAAYPTGPAFLARARRRRAAARGLDGPARARLAASPMRSRPSRPRRRGRSRRARRRARRPGRRRASPRRSTACLGPGRARRADRRARARRALPRVPARPPRSRPRRASAPGPRRSPRCADLGLVVVWDDGDDLHAEPRAPYPHVREVLAAAVRGWRAPRC